MSNLIGSGITLFFVVTFALGGCGGSSTTSSDNQTPSGNQTPPTTKTALNVTVATTWTNTNLYVVENCLDVDAPLTIQSGTIIKFKKDACIDVSATGLITALGTSAAPIVFTSIKDDAHGGDTNADGAASSPAAGDWALVFVRGNGSNFANTVFMYGGYPQSGSDGSVLKIQDKSASVTNSIFAHNGIDNSVNAGPALNAWAATTGTIITGNTFYDNIVPLGINTTFSLDNSNNFNNTIAAPAKPEPNKYNGINIAGCGTYTSNISLTANKVPFVVGDSVTACDHLNVDPSASLTLGDGVVMKFFPDGSIGVQGSLIATASSVTTPIVFTSIKDDAHGGDTNADGAASSPAAGDWSLIFVRGSGSRFANTVFMYGGYPQSGSNGSVLKIQDKNASVTNSIFAHNGIDDSVNAGPALNSWAATAGTVITGNTFYDNIVPLGINSTFSLDDSNSFDNSVAAPANPQPNKYNGINIAGCSNFTSNISLTAKKVPFVVGDSISACQGLDIDDVTVSVGTGSVFKFFNDGEINLRGQASLNNVTNALFTSIRDDARGGDTNGDGSVTTPATGDWKGFFYYGLPNDASPYWVPQLDPPIAQPAYMFYATLN